MQLCLGFLLPHEKLIIDHLNEKLEGPKYYVPIVWAGSIAAKYAFIYYFTIHVNQKYLCKSDYF